MRHANADAPALSLDAKHDRGRHGLHKLGWITGAR
jgi:hypothetical protein